MSKNTNQAETQNINTNVEEMIMDLNKMTKAELIGYVHDLEHAVDDLRTQIDTPKPKGPGRKEQVHSYLLANQPCSVSDIAEGVGIGARNVSSQLSYLRRDGINIATNARGLKFIED